MLHGSGHRNQKNLSEQQHRHTSYILQESLIEIDFVLGDINKKIGTQFAEQQHRNTSYILPESSNEPDCLFKQYIYKRDPSRALNFKLHCSSLTTMLPTGSTESPQAMCDTAR